MKLLVLEELKEKITNWSQVQCDYFSEACIVQLEELSHQSGVSLAVNEDDQTTFCLIWTKQPFVKSWRATAKLTENAATAIAFFLVVELTEYAIVEEARIGTGIDYWLGYSEDHHLYDEDNFMRARLEISGIRNSPQILSSRVRDKLKQTEPSDNTGLPAYVVVVEFSGPTAVLIKK